MGAPKVGWFRLLAVAAVTVPAVVLLTPERPSRAAAPLTQHDSTERGRAQPKADWAGLGEASGKDSDRAQVEARVQALQLEVGKLSKMVARLDRTRGGPANGG